MLKQREDQEIAHRDARAGRSPRSRSASPGEVVDVMERLAMREEGERKGERRRGYSAEEVRGMLARLEMRD